MELTSTDGAVFVYIFGVMTSALWLSAGDPQTPLVVALFGVTSIRWTASFKWQTWWLEPPGRNQWSVDQWTVRSSLVSMSSRGWALP